ncbi:MAG: HpcH/HpaI aldolase/citrate lyase family protein [Bacteroidales bacterium]|nr:HpcH/HpaI aldolase/citrate lyase family protein [Bacteroidales bacterium]
MDKRNFISATAGNTGDKVRSDCYVSVQIKNTGGIVIDIQSKVKSMYGRHMHNLTERILAFFDITHAKVRLIDSGALDFVIMARLEAAIKSITASDKSFLPDFISQNDYPSQRDAFRFSRLYLPGNTPALMLNAGIHKPNGVILDLEDSVAPDKKEEARLLVRNALRQVDFYGAERMVRINPLPAGLEDLKAVIPHNVHVVLVPKAEHPEDLVMIDKTIRNILQDNGNDREVYLMPLIETALGVENAYMLATSTPSVVAMAIGLEDYTADIGVSRTPEGSESFYARTRLVNACKAAGIQPIDSVFSDISDMEGLTRNVKASRNLGFEGMGCIHPRQIKVIHKAFEPTPEEIGKALKIVDAFAKAREKGLGVVSLGTKMIDPPVVKRAQRIVSLAKQLGLL